jgi:nitric oxide reductase activation protein
MSWDEKLFRWGLRKTEALLGRRYPASPAESPDAARLEDWRDRLKILGCALSGEAMEVKEAEVLGGILGRTLLLPARVRIGGDAELNGQALIYRVAYSVTLRELGIALPDALANEALAKVLLGLLAVPVVRSELARRYPPLLGTEAALIASELKRRQPFRAEGAFTTARDAIDSWSLALLEPGLAPPSSTPETPFFPASWPRDPAGAVAILREILPAWKRLKGAEQEHAHRIPAFWTLVYPETAAERAGAQRGQEPPKADPASLPTGTERKGKAKETVEEVKFKEDRLGENPVIHAFEKLRTADDHVGGRKTLDGDDELEDHLEALEELNLRKVIRSRDRTDSVYKADVMMDSGVGDLEDEETSEPAQFTYPEWDERARTYRENWCRIHSSKPSPTLPPAQVQEYVAKALLRNARPVRELRQQLEQLTSVRRWRARQMDGPEVDMDAAVDAQAMIRSGHSPSGGLYLSRRRQERDFATLVLLDSSLSTDSWIADRRVMDVLKESMLALGEATAQFRDKVAVGAFYSNTRNDCRYVEVKGFDEPWARCHGRLVGLHPTGYTRIGPALRHATHLLEGVEARKKLLLLISDGKPTDYDRYEGRYGIADIGQAIREAARKHVAVRALAIDTQAKFYLPRMFGQGSYQILPHPGQLARSLGQLYAQLIS